MILCDICNGAYHITFLNLEERPRGPWHCENCLLGSRQLGISDITLDKNLMDYLYYDTIPEDVAERERCKSMANCLTIGKEGELILVSKLGKLKTIPPIAERK